MQQIPTIQELLKELGYSLQYRKVMFYMEKGISDKECYEEICKLIPEEVADKVMQLVDGQNYK